MASHGMLPYSFGLSVCSVGAGDVPRKIIARAIRQLTCYNQPATVAINRQ